MIPLTFLYDEYIDRPKFTEQKKKNPFEYIVPSPTSGVGTKIKILFYKLRRSNWLIHINFLSSVPFLVFEQLSLNMFSAPFGLVLRVIDGFYLHFV